MQLNYPTEFSGKLVETDLPFELRLSNLLNILGNNFAGGVYQNALLNGPLATGLPLFDEAVTVLVAIPDLETAQDGTPTFPGKGGRLWQQLRELSSKKSANEHRNRVATQLCEWLEKQYVPKSPTAS